RSLCPPRPRIAVQPFRSNQAWAELDTIAVHMWIVRRKPTLLTPYPLPQNTIPRYGTLATSRVPYDLHKCTKHRCRVYGQSNCGKHKVPCGNLACEVVNIQPGAGCG